MTEATLDFPIVWISDIHVPNAFLYLLILYVCLYFPQQQDVSEFTHKLLDWLEDAFQMKAEEDR